MFKIGVFVVLGIILFILRKNIMNGIVGIIFLSLLIFGVLFLVDEYTHFPIREFVGLQKYDDIKHDPKGELTDIGDGIGDSGKDFIDKLNKFGEEMDAKHDTGLDSDEDLKIDSKEDKKDENVDNEKNVDKEKEDESTEDVEDKEDKKENKEKEDSKVDKSLSKNKYFYKTMNVDLKNELAHLTNKEKSIVRALSPLIDLKFESENYIIKSIKGENYYEIKEKPTEK